MNNNRYADNKIVWFPEKLQSFRDGTVTAPIYVRIKPTNRCQMACAWCSYGHGTIASGMHDEMDKREMITRSKLLEVLWDLHEMDVKAITFSGGGEPLSYPYITEAMRVVLTYGIKLSCITNGSLLENERADILREASWIRVSIDYTTPEQMIASRGVDQYIRVLANMERFAANPKRCELGVNYIVTKDNYVGLAEFCGKLKDIGVQNVRVSPVWLPNFEKYHAPIRADVMFEIDKAKRHSDSKFAVYSSYDLGSPAHSRDRTFSRCWFMQMVPVIGADQNVYACHNTAYSTHGVVGSIKDRRFKELWFSAEAKAKFEALNPQHSCQHQCAAHSKIETIEGFLAGAGDPFV
jgi:MoaA/NifB/PqqE/SkfB family radical SAM enzyme